MKHKIIYGDTLNVLQNMKKESVDMVMTSPPYWGLRDYGEDGQIGLEHTLAEYHTKLLNITAELKRVLKPTGVMFWNHGDSYGGSCNASGHTEETTNCGKKTVEYGATKGHAVGYKPKCMLMQNERLIIKMIDEQGWILRNRIIWSKPNGMPSSVQDRFSNKYEPVYMLVKNKKYWFDLDAVREEHKDSSLKRNEYGWNSKQRTHSPVEKRNDDKRDKGKLFNIAGKNPGDLWTINTQPFSGAKILADYVGADGKLYKVSEDCPVHGLHSGLQNQRKGECDELLNSPESRTSGICDYPVQELEGESVSIHSLCCETTPIKLPSVHEHNSQNTSGNKTFVCLSDKDVSQIHHHIEDIGQRCVYNLDCFSLVDVLIAILHNNQNHKSISPTSQHDMLFLKTSSHKPDIQQELFYSEQDQHIAANNILGHVFSNVRGFYPSVQNPFRSIDISYNNKKEGRVYKCTCEEVKVDHFAVFPEKLCEKPILAGCPVEVCKHCGMARVRITERNNLSGFNPSTDYTAKTDWIKHGTGKSTLHTDTNIIRETIGWTDCPCLDENKYEPGIVLDPFGGSGTVSVVAEKLGRSSISIDINPEYCEMAYKRLQPLVWQVKINRCPSVIERINF